MPFRMLVLIFWTTLCAAQTSEPICLRPFKTDWELHGVSGRVKVVRTFKTSFGKDERTGRPVAGKPHLEEEVKYDAKGKRTFWHHLLAVGTADDMVVEYDCDGPARIKEIRQRKAKDPSFSKIVYGYDEQKRLSERASYFADGTLERLEKYQYDDKGNLIEESLKQQMGAGHLPLKRTDPYVTTRQTYGYDNKRNRTSATHYLPDGPVYSKRVFEYDSRNNLTKDTRRDDQGRLEDQYRYKYDRHNRVVEEKHYANFCRTQNNEFCKGTLNSGDGEFYYLTKTVYKYDGRGNWVRQQEFSLGGQSGSQRYQPIHTLVRRFTYYK